MRIRLDSIGCRLNVSEIESMARRLADSGHRIVAQGERADLCVVNTCTVTAIASRKSRQLIRQLRRSNPAARIVVTGCLAELETSAVEALGVDLVVGNSSKDDLPDTLDDLGLLAAGSAQEFLETVPSVPPGLHTRAFVKAQDGCDNRCAFCVVTIARGRGRSRPADAIVAEIRSLRELGHQEVVLTGVHLGSYGHDLGRPRGLQELARRILDETDLPRLRLSSIEPWDLQPSFFEIFDDRRLLPHLHLPLQSGCNATLERMARKTTVRGFTDLVEAARRAIPDVAISTDIMVGFPGETDAEFLESLATVESLAFSRLHVFRYSRRNGTRASTMPDQVPDPVAAERSRRLHGLGERLADDFHRRHLGRRMRVLWEDAEELGSGRRWSGLTGNYIRVLTEARFGIDLTNRVTAAVLTCKTPGAMLGWVPGISTSGLGEPPERGLLSLGGT